MKYAILSDAHGNKVYFDACMKVISALKIRRIFYLGDMFGYMPDGKYVMENLKNLDAIMLKGNHEAMLLGELPIDLKRDNIYRLKKQKKTINEMDFQFLSALSPMMSMTINKKKILFLHGSLEDPLTGYFYEDDRKCMFKDTEYDYIFMGHTHRPFIKKKEKTTFVNVGSCGLPRDIGLSPSFCVLDDNEWFLKIERINLDEDILKKEYFAGLNQKILDVLKRKG